MNYGITASTLTTSNDKWPKFIRSDSDRIQSITHIQSHGT